MVDITGVADLNSKSRCLVHLVGHLVKSRQELTDGEDAYDNVGDNVCFVKSPPMSALV